MTTTEHADGKGHTVHTLWSALAEESHTTDFNTLAANQTDILRMQEERCKANLADGNIEAWRKEVTYEGNLITHRILTR